MPSLSGTFNVIAGSPGQAGGKTNMSIPTVQFASIGLTNVKIYPWNGATGPYDTTTAENLYGLKKVDITTTPKLAVVNGGETVHRMLAAEVTRDTDLNFSACKMSLRAFALLLGDTFAMDAADVNGAEVQVLGGHLGDRTPYFRLEAQSTLGTGLVDIVFPKLMVSGGFKYSMDAEQVTVPEFPAFVFYDPTYVAKDGTTGAAYDYFYGDGGQATRHS